jgi:hypothetical protein
MHRSWVGCGRRVPTRAHLVEVARKPLGHTTPSGTAESSSLETTDCGPPRRSVAPLREQLVVSERRGCRVIDRPRSAQLLPHWSHETRSWKPLQDQPAGCHGPEFIASGVEGWCRFSGTETVFIDPGSPWEHLDRVVQRPGGRQNPNQPPVHSLLEAQVPTEDRSIELQLA